MNNNQEREASCGQKEPQHFMMLTKKYSKPKMNGRVIFQERVIQEIGKGMGYKLLLLCAPAGYGKTTALIQWAQQQANLVTWLLLDEGDNDAIQFWSYFIQSLSFISTETRRNLLNSLQGDSCPHKKVIRMIINELGKVQEHHSIIIENYHLISNSTIHDQVAYFLNYLPDEMHVCISTRRMPQIPLALLRMRDELYEINSEYLNFNEEEISLLLNEKNVTDYDTQLILQETEGWIGGIKMVLPRYTFSKSKTSLLMHSYGVNGIIRAFFKEEVLTGIPEKMVKYLVLCAIPTTFTFSFCKELQESNTTIYFQRIKELNLFYSCVDGAEDHLRFHPLFRKHLLSLLKENYDDTFISALHKKVASWYVSRNNIHEGIHHLLEGKEFETAADLIERFTYETYKLGDIDLVKRYLSHLPEGLIESRPRLAVSQIKTLIFEGYIELARNKLENLKLDKKMEEFIRSEVIMLEAIVSFLYDKKDAQQQYNQACKYYEKVSKKSYAFLAFNNHYASILQSEFGKKGKVKKAVQYYENMLLESGASCIAATPFAYVNVLLAEAHYEMGHMEKTFNYIRSVTENPNAREDLGLIVPLQLVHMKLKVVEGDEQAGLEILRKLEMLARNKGCNHWLSIIQSHYTKLMLMIGNLDEVKNWRKVSSISIKSSINPHTSNELLTYIRSSIQLGDHQEAMILLNKMLPIVEQECGIGTIIQVYNLKAICMFHLNKQLRAYYLLERSLCLGMENGYYRIFLDEPSLKELLHNYYSSHVASETEKNQLIYYLGKLINVKEEKFEKEAPTFESPKNLELTKREKEVLIKLCEGHSNQEISEQLFISVITVKVHLKHIYRKLGVKNRAQAIISCKNLVGRI